MSKLNQINTLIKPTHSCNLRCSYCFHEKYGYTNEILEMQKLKKYIELLSDKYHYINLVWHGGEPLMVPLSYYEEIYDFCKKQDANFIFSIQTNGVLLDQQKIDFFKKNNTSIGLSFDGLKNGITRGQTNKVLDNIKLLQLNGCYPGAILVVNSSNVHNLIEEYKYFNSLNLGMKINQMFNDGAAKINNSFELNPDDYINNFIELFKYWANDKTCSINLSTCEELIHLILNEHSGVCTFNSCLGNWLCLDSDGIIYPCDRLCTEEYKLGNVIEMISIEEAFQNINFFKLLKSSVERRKTCISECEYYKNCYAGCNANAILNKNNGNNVSCHIQKEILKEVKSYILKNNNNYENMNYNYVKYLKKCD